MDGSAITATQAIQALLAPAVTISSNGLFFLGLNARQSSVYSRIRLLKEEKRKLIKEINRGTDRDRCDDIRCFSIDSQLDILVRRAWYVRNSIICCTMAVGFFVLTSFAIGINFSIANKIAELLPIYLFIIGMVWVLTGVIFLGIDECISYSVIVMEVKGEE